VEAILSSVQGDLFMVYPRNCRAARRLSLAAVLAVAGILLAAQPASAQIWISSDRSIVRLPRAQPFPVVARFPVTPVVLPGNRSVRIGVPFSGAIVNPGRGGYPGTGFLQPFYANDRIRGANFSGTGGAIVTGPFQPWW
jgi:hypothetical protein